MKRLRIFTPFSLEKGNFTARVSGANGIAISHEEQSVMRQACYVSWRPATEASLLRKYRFLAEDLS
jgi:hypothetical protein